MIIQKKVVKASKNAKRPAIKASTLRTRKRAVRANDEVVDEVDEEIVDDIDDGGVDVAPEASDLLFEAEDVAELVAEVTGKDVAVTAEEDTVTFEVGDDVFTVEADGDEEALEASTRAKRSNKVTASKRVLRRRTPARRAARK